MTLPYWNNKASRSAPVRGEKTQEGNVSLHLPWNIADKSRKQACRRRLQSGPVLAKKRQLTTPKPRLYLHKSAAFFSPLNVEVSILSTQATQRTQCTNNVIDISPWLTCRKSNKKLTCEPTDQSEGSIAWEDGSLREDMTEVTAMFCNSVCIPPLQYLPFAWFCMWGKCHCGLTVPWLPSTRQSARPFVYSRPQSVQPRVRQMTTSFGLLDSWNWTIFCCAVIRLNCLRRPYSLPPDALASWLKVTCWNTHWLFSIGKFANVK